MTLWPGTLINKRANWMPMGGLALAISLSTAIETTTLFFLLRRRLKGIQARGLAQGLGAALLGTLAMAAGLVLWMKFAGSASFALITLVGVAIGGIVYGLVLTLLRVPELHSAFGMIKRRLQR